MFIHTRGIILKTTKFGESSLILDAFTEEKGRIPLIVSGIRGRSKSNKQSYLHPFSLVEFTSYYKPNSNALNRIKEIKTSPLLVTIPFDIKRSSIGMFIIEICQKSIKKYDPNLEMFLYLRDKFIKLDTCPSDELSNFHINFLIQFSHLLGIGLEENSKETEHMWSMIKSNRDKKTSIMQNPENHKFTTDLNKIMADPNTTLSKSGRNLMIDHILLYYDFHLDGFDTILSLDILRNVFK